MWIIQREKMNLKTICEETIKENPLVIKDVLRGKQSSKNFLIGIVMRKTRGEANLKEVILILQDLIYYKK